MNLIFFHLDPRATPFFSETRTAALPRFFFRLSLSHRHLEFFGALGFWFLGFGFGLWVFFIVWEFLGLEFFGMIG